MTPTRRPQHMSGTLVRREGFTVAKHGRRKHEVGGPALEAVAGAVVGLSVGYIMIEGIMRDGQHPVHWFLAILVGAAGHFSGGAWYRLKQR